MLALALAACERPHTGAPVAVPAVAPAPAPAPTLAPTHPPAAHIPSEAAPIPPTPMQRAHFACADGLRVEWRYFPLQGVAVLVRAGRNHELHPPPGGSAGVFAQPGLEVQLGAESLRIHLGAGPSIDCQRVAAS
ncbi:glucan-binding domain protein, YG repeat [Serpentinimonas maccroryi]|uniref:Glucan-binding domain protein, YG repeat n=2 Tax=Serpentinimonas maccroryi TaxID=1458426 RepID=A0A060NVZ9_9BURK|nr:glucan-binding domain protein, YG repeat [Serpentinimonas maccroryi]